MSAASPPQPAAPAAVAPGSETSGASVTSPAVVEAPIFAHYEARLRQAMTEQTRAVIVPQTAYNHDRVKAWVTDINAAILKAAKELTVMPDALPAYKLMVSTVIAQRSGAGLKIQASAYWQESTDGSIVVTVETSNIIAIATLFACALV